MENCGATGVLLLLLLPAAGGVANMEPAGGAGGYAGVNGLIAFLPLLLLHLFGAFVGYCYRCRPVRGIPLRGRLSRPTLPVREHFGVDSQVGERFFAPTKKGCAEV